jgi:protein subunit release factor B
MSLTDRRIDLAGYVVGRKLSGMKSVDIIIHQRMVVGICFSEKRVTIWTDKFDRKKKHRRGRANFEPVLIRPAAQI